MENGAAWVNKHLDMGPSIPFTDTQASGVGVENGDDSLHEFAQLHVINIAK